MKKFKIKHIIKNIPIDIVWKLIVIARAIGLISQNKKEEIHEWIFEAICEQEALDE